MNKKDFLCIIKVISTYSFVILLIITLFTPINTYAQNLIPSKESICNGKCPLIDSEFVLTDSKAIVNFILGIARLLTYISGALAVLFIVYGGFMIVTDWGNGNRAKKGWVNIRTSILGLVIVILAYTAVGLIGGLTTSDILSQFLN